MGWVTVSVRTPEEFAEELGRRAGTRGMTVSGYSKTLMQVGMRLEDRVGSLEEAARLVEELGPEDVQLIREAKALGLKPGDLARLAEEAERLRGENRGLRERCKELEEVSRKLLERYQKLEGEYWKCVELLKYGMDSCPQLRLQALRQLVGPPAEGLGGRRSRP